MRGTVLPRMRWHKESQCILKIRRHNRVLWPCLIFTMLLKPYHKTTTTDLRSTTLNFSKQWEEKEGSERRVWKSWWEHVPTGEWKVGVSLTQEVYVVLQSNVCGVILLLLRMVEIKGILNVYKVPVWCVYIKVYYWLDN